MISLDIFRNVVIKKNVWINMGTGKMNENVRVRQSRNNVISGKNKIHETLLQNVLT